MLYVYKLEHSYSYYTVDNEQQEETKFIGVFSTYEKAEKVLQELFQKVGFNQYPIDCFSIDMIAIDESIAWIDGFITWDDETIRE